ncbi:MAG: UDP-N-acetylmuramoyl-tripeptide--D-alanyl-D-alanine ligase [Deltaproteobacteria bacterium]|jgi:UDP-N-acetylmuramoyl-tripeptide--D-alanyl-D-alanine ligase|nr:UDP-N-acetylmuramoyl-tripeptide--D-alanyl-D-alanine ligase [Deltaproteobacteria bacterium]
MTARRAIAPATAGDGAGNAAAAPGGLASLGLTVAGSLRNVGLAVPEALAGAADMPLVGVSTDSRTIRPRELFVALSGPNFDGGDFVAAAFAKGAAAAVAAEGFRSREAGLGDPARGKIAYAGDPLVALGDLARVARRASGCRLAAITGSVGKTAVKELLKAVFEEGLGPTLATEGNFNNQVGVPWTLFRLARRHRAAVVELGAGDFGEIARLAEITEPDLALVTRIAPAHLEAFGSLEGVARAKGELFAGLGSGAVAVVNLGDPFVKAMGAALAARESPCGIFTFGPEGSGAELELSELSELPGGGFRLLVRGGAFGEAFGLTVTLPGRHNAHNAFAAAAAASAAGVGPEAIARGLAKATLPAGRGETVLSGGLAIVDSSYNASPVAVAAELARLSGLSAPRGALLGDMLELGEAGPELHREAGRRAAESGLDYLALAGRLSRHTLEGALDAGFPRSRARHFSDAFEAAEWARGMSGGKGTLLVKGSRSTGLWKTVGLLAPEVSGRAPRSANVDSAGDEGATPRCTGEP